MAALAKLACERHLGPCIFPPHVRETYGVPSYFQRFHLVTLHVLNYRVCSHFRLSLNSTLSLQV